jgi:isoleucyl-tRNA synthetase
MERDPLSVHLCSYPAYHPEIRDKHLEDAMRLVQVAVSLGHSLRKSNDIKVRQPLKRAYLISSNPTTLALLQEERELIADELNVQEIVFSRDESQFVTLQAKPNFRILGKKIGKLMKSAQTAIGALDVRSLLRLMNGETIAIEIEGEKIELNNQEVEVERLIIPGVVAGNLGDITVALDTELNDELLELGLAREIVNKLNLMRKEQRFDIADRINVSLETTERVKECIEKHQSYIAGEVLALSFHFGKTAGTEWDLNGEKAVIQLDRVAANAD